MHSFSPNLDGARSSGAMKGVVPSPTVDLDDCISRLGSYMIVANSESVRHAETGSVSVIRILA